MFGIFFQILFVPNAIMAMNMKKMMQKHPDIIPPISALINKIKVKFGTGDQVIEVDKDNVTKIDKIDEID